MSYSDILLSTYITTTWTKLPYCFSVLFDENMTIKNRNMSSRI